MRRPLFMVCLCLVILMAVRMVLREGEQYKDGHGDLCNAAEDGLLQSGKADENIEEVVVPAFPEALDGQQLVITGRVYQKDTKAFYIDNIIIHSTFQENSAANQQQILSNVIKISDKLICEYGAVVYENEAATAIYDVGTYKDDMSEEIAAFAKTIASVEEICLGAEVKLQVELQLFMPATNPGEFDAAEYYGSLGIAGKLKDVVLLESGEKYKRWQEGLFRVKEYFRQRLYRIFPEKEAGIMTAMLLGDKSGLDGDLKSLFQENGIIHILSISGLHITIIGMSLYKLLRRLGLPVLPAAVLGGGVLLLYGVMTGMSVSACRAIGMYLIHMLAEVVGRTYDMLTALGIMAVFMVWNNSSYLQSAGFYLSFGAVLGIGVLYPALAGEEKERKVKPYEEKEWKRRLARLMEQLGAGLCQSTLASVSITLTTLPILLWFYYEIPVYSVFINLLVLPFMSVVMPAGLFAMLVPGLGIVGTIDCIILAWYEQLCHWFETLPFHTWNPGRPQVWQMVVYYGIWLGVVWLGEIRKKEGGKQMIYERKPMPLIACVGAVMLLAVKYPARTVLSFLDVGQGDCICLQTASGEVYLFDCGSSSRSDVGEYVLKPFLKYYGIQQIDAVFVSHPDTDHCSGVKELLENSAQWGITVEQLVLPNVENKEEDEKLCALQNAAYQATQKKEVELYYVSAGDIWQTEELQLFCLHPPREWDSEDSNAYSECFYVEFVDTGLDLLLTGDVQGEGETLLLEELQERGIGPIDLLKVAHHGSRNSSAVELLEQLRPTLSIISCSEDNSYGHPHKETLERLENVDSKVMATKDCGAITIEIGREVEVYGFAE